MPWYSDGVTLPPIRGVAENTLAADGYCVGLGCLAPLICSYMRIQRRALDTRHLAHTNPASYIIAP